MQGRWRVEPEMGDLRSLVVFCQHMLAAFVLVCTLFGNTGAIAQIVLDQPEANSAAVELPSPLTPETVRDLVSTLSDEDVRALLLARLDAVARDAEDARAARKSVTEMLGQAISDTYRSTSEAVIRTPEMPTGIWRGIARFFTPRGWSGTLFLLGMLLAAVVVGRVAEIAINRLFRRWRDRIQTEAPETLSRTLTLLLRRVVINVIGLVVFYLVAERILLLTLSPEPPTTDDGTQSFPDSLIAVSFLWWAVMLPRAMRTLTQFLFTPYTPALRLVHTDDATAQFLHQRLTIVFAIWGGMLFFLPFLASHGSPLGELRVGFWLNVAAFAVLLHANWRCVPGLAMMMRGSDPNITAFEERLARAYPYVAIGLIAATWFLIEALAAQRLWGATTNAILTMVILLFTPTFDTAVRGLVRHLVPPMSGDGDVAESAYLSTKRSYIRIGRVVIAVGVILFIAWLWGLDLVNLAAAGIGAQIAGRLLEVVMILLAGFLVWELCSLWINGKLAAEHTAALTLDEEEPGGGEGGGAGVSRLATVLPLMLGTLKVAIAVVFVLIALGNIGIDITPLLAGAGIVGIAIGFGAQKLVTDVVSGVFFLIDDAFRVGEYVEVEGTRGTVEKISVRSMQLRHHLGPVHTIPYGEIPKLSNFSRDWVIMKLKFTVPFETDPSKVKKLFKQVGKEMMEVPEFAEDLLQPFKSQGVFDFDDVGMIIRGKFMAKPGRQFVLRKEIYNRVKKTLEENGIPFARREVRIALPEKQSAADLDEAQTTAIATAAAQVVQDGIASGTPEKDAR